MKILRNYVVDAPNRRGGKNSTHAFCLGCRRKPRQPLRSVFVHEQPSARPKVCRVVEQSHLCRRKAIGRGLIGHGIDDADQGLALWDVVKSFGWLRQPFRAACRNKVIDLAFGRAGSWKPMLDRLSQLRVRVQPVHVMPEDGCSIVDVPLTART